MSLKPTDSHLRSGKLSEYERMEIGLAYFEPRKVVAEAIIAAYNDPEWPWQKCDGCTFVSEAGSPKGTKFAPCVMHDHLCWLAAKGETPEERDRLRRHADRMFRWAMQDYGKTWSFRWRRWCGVRLGWWCWVRWGAA